MRKQTWPRLSRLTIPAETSAPLSPVASPRRPTVCPSERPSDRTNGHFRRHRNLIAPHSLPINFPRLRTLFRPLSASNVLLTAVPGDSGRRPFPRTRSKAWQTEAHVQLVNAALIAADSFAAQKRRAGPKSGVRRDICLWDRSQGREEWKQQQDNLASRHTLVKRMKWKYLVPNRLF